MNSGQSNKGSSSDINGREPKSRQMSISEKPTPLYRLCNEYTPWYPIAREDNYAAMYRGISESELLHGSDPLILINHILWQLVNEKITPREAVESLFGLNCDSRGRCTRFIREVLIDMRTAQKANWDLTQFDAEFHTRGDGTFEVRHRVDIIEEVDAEIRDLIREAYEPPTTSCD